VKHVSSIKEYELCHACRAPLNAAGRTPVNFVTGVSCDSCIDQRTDEQRARYAARQDQVRLAEKKGETHIGATFGSVRKPTVLDE